MPNVYSLAHLTALALPPPQLVQVAARTGYQMVGLRLAPAAPGGRAYSLMQDARLLAATLACMKDLGVGVFDLELVRVGAPFRAADHLPFFEVGAKLGAKALLVAGDDEDEARLTASFAALCQAAAPFGLSADLEFMPWTKVPDARTALRIVLGAAQPNGGVLVDALHVARSATSLADVAAIPRQCLHYAQICDAPAEVPATVEGLIHTARCERLLPGDGGIDLAGIFSLLPRDLPISVEIPHDREVVAIGAEEWARRALAASKRVLEKIEPHSAG
ncbi:MAG TPA: sugar phosphate isomerase/epimerase [Hyphomicrobiaceae bacterium]|jgi:sugar phosphate isomerase/epimerase